VAHALRSIGPRPLEASSRGTAGHEVTGANRIPPKELEVATAANSLQNGCRIQETWKYVIQVNSRAGYRATRASTRFEKLPRSTALINAS